MGFRVEGVLQASLTSDMLVARRFQHSWRGLARLSHAATSSKRTRGIGGGGGKGEGGEGLPREGARLGISRWVVRLD